VAAFIGDPPTNVVAATLHRKNKSLLLDFEGNELPVPEVWLTNPEINGRDNILLGLRPSDINIRKEKGESSFEAEVYVSETMQRKQVITLQVGRVLIKANEALNLKINIGDKVWGRINLEKALLFDPETKKTIYLG
jgi:ABC-type sugar transport system ATPase subunit